MRRISLACLFAVLSAAPASAQDPFCEQLWYTRNLIIDRAGYCFSSNLGRAVFDNSDCVTNAPALSPLDAEAVAQIRSSEEFGNCRVDTTATRLQWGGQYRPMIDRLQDIPARDIGESGCIGYLGAPLALHAGASTGAPVIGELRRGDNIGFGHWDRAGFTFVTVFDQNGDGTETRFGWTRISIAEASCEGFAG